MVSMAFPAPVGANMEGFDVVAGTRRTATPRDTRRPHA